MVILLAVLFGKKRDPSKPSRLKLCKAARAAARDGTVREAAVRGRSRD